jgi:signal transduction histidine kinase/DNA-binding response OmpR family regulator
MSQLSSEREALPWLGASEMAGRVRDFDWSQTPLGPISSWPQSLKSVAAICLHSPFQMAIYWGPELNCIYNDAERDVLGNLHPGALGQPASKLLRDSWEITGPQLQRVVDRGETTWAEDQPLTVDRRGIPEVAYFTYSYSPILDDDGNVGGVLLVTQDTTDRVLAERRLAALRDLAAGSMDAPTERQACEQAAAALAGSVEVPFVLIYEVDHGDRRARCVAARAHQREVEPRHPIVDLNSTLEGPGALFSALADRRSDGTLVDSKLVIVPDPDGPPSPGRAYLTAVARGATDPTSGLVIAGVSDELRFDPPYEAFMKMAATGIGRSVAAARARESERERADAISALDRAKTALFSDASHELRTPLALILGNLDELLEDGRLPASARDPLAAAHRGAMRMLKLVGALLDFSRIEAGAEIAAAPTDVAQLTSEIAATFRSTVERAGLRLVVDCPRLAAPAYVDRDAWERIVSNLLSNSLKFTLKGEIRVRTRAQDGELWLTVQDTGIGIATDELERVFERFYRALDSRARTREGLGIGLALVRELVQLHRGSIEARSDACNGTTMIVRVPLGSDHLPSASVAAWDVAGRRGSTALFVAEANGWLHDPPSTPDEALHERLRAVVAEDNADMRAYLRRLLSPDFTVVLARDGTEARELALHDPPSVVISDVMMPGLDGFELVRELRRDPRTRELPIVLLSARGDPESTLQALKLGADDYIVKPFGARELLARIRSTVDGSRLRAQAAAARGREQERTRREGELRALLNDLRAAQRRVAAAGDAERRRIERDLHDGAQQRLTAIRIELGMLEETLDANDPGAAARLHAIREQINAALEELRELGHGVYPPLLASDGLHAALAATARRAAIPVMVQGRELARAPRSIESNAYFCCLEAIQNCAKHAGPGASVSVDLSIRDGVLEFRVTDDGVGFDANAVRPGHGLINMRDRLDALGGHAEITSAPGQGTTVHGQLPLP